jgi:hypothetical protein
MNLLDTVLLGAASGRNQNSALILRHSWDIYKKFHLFGRIFPFVWKMSIVL